MGKGTIDPMLYARYEAWANVFKALAHPARLFIINELKKGERCVNELTEMLGVDASTVSRHLSALKNVGIIGSRREGAQVFYFLRMPCVIDFCSCVESVLGSIVRERLELLT